MRKALLTRLRLNVGKSKPASRMIPKVSRHHGPARRGKPVGNAHETQERTKPAMGRHEMREFLETAPELARPGHPGLMERWRVDLCPKSGVIGPCAQHASLGVIGPKPEPFLPHSHSAHASAVIGRRRAFGMRQPRRDDHAPTKRIARRRGRHHLKQLFARGKRALETFAHDLRRNREQCQHHRDRGEGGRHACLPAMDQGPEHGPRAQPQSHGPGHVMPGPARGEEPSAQNDRGDPRGLGTGDPKRERKEAKPEERLEDEDEIPVEPLVDGWPEGMDAVVVPEVRRDVKEDRDPSREKSSPQDTAEGVRRAAIFPTQAATSAKGKESRNVCVYPR
jgi:hypothetical protein